ncbi:extracellular serine/threonine protein kinase four-jointed [Atheta coriaria]|uniref:extracellular serine/threonine protein kinase four-jointed n=1 Tax=Dalotia coriaria TaxID=877792 RepID=UPI0031F3E308
MFDYNNLPPADSCHMSKATKVTIWDSAHAITTNISNTNNHNGKKTETRFYCLTLCIVSAFAIGLCFGVLGPFYYASSTKETTITPANLNTAREIEGIFVNHSFSTQNLSSVSFINNSSQRDLVYEDIYWSDYVESLLPPGFTRRQADEWNRYVRKGAVAIKLEKGCGRMQNRLVTFADGRRACVRYRQNTDQIQGELFSFYLSQILNLKNLVPSAVGVVDVQLPIWTRLSNEIASAQWSSQRPVVLTQFIPDLDVGSIPKLVRPAESDHLNKLDIREQNLQKSEIIELAQWSDLIIFDYLTANLDRVVNNLYNHQWNSNIMEAPAHNLAKNSQTNLLVFLDNESGLLHGYRLLEKYEAYHGLLLDNLCIFRRSTAQAIATLRREGNVGQLLRAMFERRNPERIKDVLPTIPEKSVKILNARIRRVHEQILKCQGLFKSSDAE